MPTLRAILRTLVPALGLCVAVGCGSSTPGETGTGGAGGSGGSGGAPIVDKRPDGVALCYSDLADNHPATAAFWAAFGEGDRDARAAAIDALQAAVDENPNEEELTLLLGLAHLWRVAEPLDAEAADQGVILQSALGAKSNLEKAYQLCPTDYRIPAWLGPVLVNMGRAIKNQDTIDQGLAVLKEGIDHYPSFVLFSKLLVYADQPAADPEFQNALQAVWDNADACGDIATSPDPACRDTPQAAHNIEGSIVFLGDVFAKAGRRDDALGFYQQGKTGPAYASWGFKDLLDGRIADIDARIAAATDADPSNDPDSVWQSNFQCAICHTR